MAPGINTVSSCQWPSSAYHGIVRYAARASRTKRPVRVRIWGRQGHGALTLTLGLKLGLSAQASGSESGWDRYRRRPSRWVVGEVVDGYWASICCISQIWKIFTENLYCNLRGHHEGNKNVVSGYEIKLLAELLHLVSDTCKCNEACRTATHVSLIAVFLGA